MILVIPANILTETAVDNILIALANNGLTGGHVYINGTGNAAPSATGITAKNTLISRGWSVVTN